VSARSLADRISSGEKTSEKPKVEEVNKVGATSQSEEKQKEKGIKESETNLIRNKYEVAVKLQDLQADPNSPLFSVKSFDELGL
jgi:ATP-dependent RNA helicase DDX19/DBP5